MKNHVNPNIKTCIFSKITKHRTYFIAPVFNLNSYMKILTKPTFKKSLVPV